MSARSQLYDAGRDCPDSAVPVSAALLVKPSIPLVIYSVQIRPYALVSPLILVSVGAIVKGLSSESRVWPAMWAVSLPALVCTHYLGSLVAAGSAFVAHDPGGLPLDIARGARSLGRGALGTPAAGIVVAGLFSRGRRIAGALWLETRVISTFMEFIQVVGYPRINIDLTGAFIRAEAMPGEVVVGASGATAACLNRQIRFPVMRLNYSLLGAATVFPFDHEFERMADIGSLHATPDNLDSACRTGRGVWFVAEAPWTYTGPVPLAIRRDEFGASIRPSVASRGLAGAWCHL